MPLVKKKILYKAFGLKINSQIVFPELLGFEEDDELEEVKIEKDDLNTLWSNLGVKGKFIVKGNIILFQIPNTATFCIEGGNKISVSPMKDANEDKIRLFILGSCMGALLMQRNVYPLHGSTVEINGNAYAFIGDSGVGKSTLATAFLKRGYHLLSDDVVAVSFSPNNSDPYVIPSYPQQKLWKESLSKLNMNSNDYNPLFERGTKYAVPVSSQYYSERLPLKGIFEIVKSNNDNIKIQPVDTLDGLQTLYRHTYRNILVPRLGMLDWHFKCSTNILKNIKLYELNRPILRFTAEEIVSLVLNTIYVDKEND